MRGEGEKENNIVIDEKQQHKEPDRRREKKAKEKTRKPTGCSNWISNTYKNQLI